jgi:hypothetical protein
VVIDNEQVRAWEDDGFVVLTEFLGLDELGPAIAALPTLFPTADGFHDRSDERHARFRGDEFAGIDPFPMGSVEVSLACVHPRLLALARALLGHDDLRVYSAEAWAKYTGAADYEQLSTATS